MDDVVKEYFVVSVPGGILDDERVIVSERPLAGDVKLAGPYDTWTEANEAIPDVILAWQVMES
jgi:hypothetical protein